MIFWEKIKTSFWEKKFEIISFFLIFVSLFILIHNSISSFELDPHDEPSFYLFQSVFETPADWGPIYVLWYKLLSLLIPFTDFLGLYLINAQVQILFIFVINYGIIRKMQLEHVPSILFSALIAFTPLVFYIPRRPNHFALILVLLFFLFSQFTQKKGNKKLILTLGFILASYVRPEYFLISIPYLALTLINLLKSYLSSKREFDFVLLPLLLLSFLNLFLWGIPAGNKEGKSLKVFLQKNVERSEEVKKINYNNWNQKYGNPSTVLEAVLNAPQVFFSHATHNAKRSFLNLESYFLSFSNYSFHNILFLIFTYIIFLILSSSTPSVGEGAEVFKLFSFLTLPEVFASIIWGPLEQYFVGVYTAIIFVIGYFLFKRRLSLKRQGIVLVFLFVSILFLRNFPPTNDHVYGHVKKFVDEAREKFLRKKINILQVHDSGCFPSIFLASKGTHDQVIFCSPSEMRYCCLTKKMPSFPSLNLKRCYGSIQDVITHEDISILIHNGEKKDDYSTLGFSRIPFQSYLDEWQIFSK